MVASSLKGKILFITGASRGIGKAIAIRAAKDGANIVIVAKTVEPHPKLPGTIYTAAEEVVAAGGKALAVACDIRFEDQVANAVKKTIETFGGIDIVVNNASAIHLAPTTETSIKSYDLMYQVNVRGTFLVSKLAIPHLMRSSNPHILNLSPPLSMKSEWFAPHLAYTMSKYGMSMCVLGLAEELRPKGIAVNALWPKTAIATSALQAINAESVALAIGGGRTPEIVADAAHIILTQRSRDYTGHFAIDEDILKSQGVSNFDKYLVTPGNKELIPDFFVESGYTSILPPPKGSTTSAPGSAASMSSVISNDKMVASGFKASDVFQSLNTSMSESESKRARFIDKAKAIFEFEIKNPAGKVQTWTIDLKNSPGSIFLGKGPVKADIVLSLGDVDFMEFSAGNLSGQRALMSGKLKVKGNMMLAMKLESVLKALRNTSKL